MKFQLEGEPFFPVEDRAELRALIARIDGDFHNFGILENDCGDFIQAGWQKKGFLLEKQLGGLQNHYRAVLRGSSGTATDRVTVLRRYFRPKHSEVIGFEDVVYAFLAFMGLESEPHSIEWRKMTL